MGGKRLDTVLHESPPDVRLQLLQDVLVRLAVFHASSGSLSLDLPSKGTGVRLADASPRALYVYNGVVRPLNYGQLKQDIVLLDVIELVCDPAVQLTPEEEFDLLKYYIRARFPAEDDQSAVLAELLRLAVHYRA